MTAPDRIAALLDETGLQHSPHHDDTGCWASLRMQGVTGEPVSISARLHGEVLTLVLHDALVTPLFDNDLRLFDEVNRRWAIGCVHRPEESNAYAASVGLPLRHGELPPATLRAAVFHLTDAAASIRRYAVPEVALPESAVGDGMDDVALALNATGLRFEVRNQGQLLSLACAQAGGQAFQVELWKSERRFLRLRATQALRCLLPDDAATLRRLSALNGRFSIGAVTLPPGGGAAQYLLALALDWTPIDDALLVYLVAGAGSALDTVAGVFDRALA